ncbi:MAG: hypothetical protein HY900_10775 [Deltaproteobacteria bacterium]|nr:hypothetical protein [Deltaproteobacteria bacterium]
MAQKGGSVSVGPIGLDIELRLGDLRNTLESLTSALTGPVEMLTDTVADAVGKFRSAGVQGLRYEWECCQRGDESCCHEESRDLYSRITEQLRYAADKGIQSARSLLEELGEAVEGVGKTVGGAVSGVGQTVGGAVSGIGETIRETAAPSSEQHPKQQ